MSFNWAYQTKFEDVLRAQVPKAFNFCRPRRIIPPHGYANPSHFAHYLLSNLVMSGDDRMNLPPHFAAVSTTLRLLQFEVPTYFLAEDWLKAVLMTDPPLDWIIEDTVQWPMEAMVFVLPDSMARIEGHYAPFLAVARILKTDDLPDLSLVKRLIHSGVEVVPRRIDVVPRNRMAMFYPLFFSESDDPITYTGNFLLESPLSEVLASKIEDATPYEYEMMGLSVKGKDSYPASAPTGELETRLQKTLVHTVMKILLALSVYDDKDVIEVGTIQRPAKMHHGRLREALWNPNIIGRNYRIKREAPTGGSHASPVMHWRRGHYRKQPFGIGRSQMRIIRIEPMLINAEKGKQ